MDFKFVRLQTFDNHSRRLIRFEDCRHFEFILLCKARFDKTGINELDLDTDRCQIRSQIFGKMNDGGFAGAITNSRGQAAITGYAADQRDMPSLARYESGENAR